MQLYQKALDLCIERIRHNIGRFDTQFPYIGSGDHYVLRENDHWMTSFWTGQLWLAYAATNDAVFREAASSHLASFRQRLEKRVDLSHDIGFLYTLSARAQFDLTADSAAQQLALEAADHLADRFNPTGDYIQAWGEMGDSAEAGRFIIDCLLNLPLLYWASVQTGDPRYADIANRHAETTRRYLVRPDGSTAHTFYMDTTTGEPIGQKTHQGYSDDSLWARGQAWAILGFATAYAWHSEPAFLVASQHTADRFLAEISADYFPLWDFRLPADAIQARDTSAAAIAAMGLLRLAELPECRDKSAHYSAAANKLITRLVEQAFDWSEDGVEGLLRHATYHASRAEYREQYTLFGDYFFLECLLWQCGHRIDLWG